MSLPRKRTVAGMVAALTVAVVAGVAPIGHAQNQNQLNMQANDDFKAADAKLNQTYKRLAGKLDKQSIAKLKTAQRAWITFRDAEADLQADVDARGGSMAPMIYDGTRAALTKSRTKELEKMLE